MRPLFALLLAMCWGMVLADQLTGQAEELLQAGRGEEAYELLAPELAARAGDPAFDYLLGLAALDAGHPMEAVFALERVLDAQPDNVAARAELARAYFELGERHEARQEFELVSQEELPPSVQETINRYLSAIGQQLAGAKARFDAYISMGLGFDSNTNSATSDTTLSAPGLGLVGLKIDASSREQASAIWELATGIDFLHPLRGDLDLYGGIHFDQRIATRVTQFNTRTADGNVGLNYSRGDEVYGLQIAAERYFVAGTPNRDTLGATLSWRHALDPASSLTAFGGFAIQRYPDQEARNVNTVSGGLGYERQLDLRYRPRLYASIYAGADNELHDSRQDIGRDYGGLRIGAGAAFNRRLTGYASLDYQYSHYQGDDPLFLKRRRDHYAALNLGANYHLSGHFRLLPELRYTWNYSTLPLNRFDRLEAMVTVRNDF
ncbi:MAG: DUF560 domain-containing protein [Gammaproteobacteria bacterium]|nr:MAG: DUF560 domain-containing protein [Gammaproteobacteria bacterium]